MITRTLSLTTLSLALALGGCASRTIVLPPDETAAKIAKATELADRAQAAERKDKFEEAIDYYRQAVSIYPEFTPAWNNLGVLLMNRNEYAPAAEAFRRASDLSPTDPRPPTNLGLIYLNRGYAIQAAEYFSQAIERDDTYLPALRESVRVDVRTDRITDVTSTRVAKAILLETDGRWLEQLRRYKSQIEQRLAAKEGMSS